MTKRIRQNNFESSAQPAEEKDLIVSFFTNIWKSCKKHKKALLTALVILIVAGVLGYVYTSYTHKRTENSWAAYYQAQMAVLYGDTASGFQQFDTLAKDYPNTPAANYGQLLKGDILYSQENYAQAVDVYRPLTNAGQEMVSTAATLSLAAALQATNDYQGSADVASNFITHNPKSFALPQAYLTLAMSQELAGKKQEALDAYKYLLENYTKTYFGALAKDKIADLQKNN